MNVHLHLPVHAAGDLAAAAESSTPMNYNQKH